MHRVRMLLHFGIIPYIVFDGDYLPSKAQTENDRARRREESKQKGLEFYRLQKHSLAQLEFQKSVDVSPEMARQFIDELKKIGVQYVVAPYEADAEMVYLEKKGIIQGILSEDSDLLVFGAKRLLTKLDQYGDCIEVNRADFTSCKEISLIGWTDADFRRMAILSGCDYLANINRMGLKSAYRLVRKYKNIEKIVRMLQFDGQYHVPVGYLEAFHRAELTFLHQRVFCPLVNEVIMMSEPDSASKSQDLSFIGEPIEQKIAIGVAKGDLDPMTKAPIRVQTSAIATPPKTPWTNPRKTIAGTNSSITKEGISIESFFKNKRTPLAELDVNTFTPSPTQEQLLRQHENTSWDSSPAPAVTPALPTAASVPTHSPRPDLPGDRSSISGTLARLGNPKKRRLMGDKDIFQSPDEVQGTSSRFFTAAVPDTTPTVKGPRKVRKKATDFSIWSDDSVEDAMVELAGASHTSSQTQKSTNEDSKKPRPPPPTTTIDEHHSEAIIQEDSQASHLTKATVYSQSSMSTPLTSFTSSAKSDSHSVTIDEHVKADSAELREHRRHKPTENSQHTGREKPKPSLTRPKSMSALQRLGVGALSRTKSCTELMSNPLDHVPSFDVLLSRNPSDNAPDKVPKQPPLSLPHGHTFGPDATMTKGSEDAMIPDSGDDAGSDADAEVGREEGRSLRPILNLGQFAFTQ